MYGVDTMELLDYGTAEKVDELEEIRDAIDNTRWRIKEDMSKDAEWRLQWVLEELERIVDGVQDEIDELISERGGQDESDY